MPQMWHFLVCIRDDFSSEFGHHARRRFTGLSLTFLVKEKSAMEAFIYDHVRTPRAKG